MVSLSDLRKKYKGDTEIDLIIADTLNIDRSRLFFDISVGDKQAKEIDTKVNRLLKGEPVSYIIGHREFMSLDFAVNPSTLIPRQDTEILVEEIIRFYKGKSPFIFEIGTGSGCIAVSLAHYISGARLTACDISEKALDTAKLNAEKNGVLDKISFIHCDIMDCFPDFEAAPDCIVSNPPYIESEVIKTLEPQVKDFEPLSALDGGLDGLDFYRRIIECSNLKPGGLLAFEIGYNQGKKVKNLMSDCFENIKIIKDLAQNDRVVLGAKKRL